MTKVRIDTPGWPQDGHGPAAGFSAMERRWSPQSNGSAMLSPPAPAGFAAPMEAS